MVTERISFRHNGVTVWTDCMRVSGSGLIYGSFFGPHNAVRALWADIVLAKKFSLDVLDVKACPIKERYVTASAPLSKGESHIVVAAASATSMVGLYDSEFYVIAGEPEKAWWSRFKRLLPVPVRDTWREYLWEKGMAARLVQTLDGFGTPGACVVVAEKRWFALIRNALKSGELT